jgi:hypothetical protein
LQQRYDAVTLGKSWGYLCTGIGEGMDFDGHLNVKIANRGKNTGRLFRIGLQFTFHPDST